jgi:hypothetical protein
MKMNSRSRVLILAACLLAAPVMAAAQDGRVVVLGAIGTNLNGGGYAAAVSGGIAVTPFLDILISAERYHIPTQVDRHVDGFSVTRNGTTTFVSGEARFTILPSRRVAPFAMAGIGRGRAVPNVNEHFPRSVTYDAGLLFIGGGVRARVAGPLSAFAESRVVLQVDSSDGIYGFVPLRGGLALRF